MNKTVTIFGGSGFIGGHIIRRLSKLGFRIIVPVSDLSSAPRLRLYGNLGQILPIRNNLELDFFKKVISESDFVINLRTIWKEEKNKNFLTEIYNFNKIIINEIKKDKRKKYIFFSGIGIKINSQSKRTNAIANSEKSIQENLTNYSIIRPSVVIGLEDKFMNRIIPLIKHFFIIPIFGKGIAKFQPVYVDDVAKAIEKIIIKSDAEADIYELGGNNVITYKQLYNFIIDELGKKRLLINIPFPLAKFGTILIEKTPFDIINSEQLQLFASDNVVTGQHKLFKNLNIEPRDVMQIIKNIIDK